MIKIAKRKRYKNIGGLMKRILKCQRQKVCRSLWKTEKNENGGTADRWDKTNRAMVPTTPRSSLFYFKLDFQISF